MARPRVFVSSTYYDLKHLRSSLENFVESLGFDAVVSEKGKIAYAPDIKLDESCYREVANCDVFVLIVGGRYGSEASAEKTAVNKRFYDRYNSITRGEYKSAVDRNIPIYVLIERSVHAEYETYLKNKGNEEISYAHVDSVNIFELIESILGQPRNNPIQQFDRYSEIEGWLREQWAGLFRELLQRIQAHTQIASLQAEVAQLSELNTTFKRYLEKIISNIAPRDSESLIKTETKRLEVATLERMLRASRLADHLISIVHFPLPVVRRAVFDSRSLEGFLSFLRDMAEGDERMLRILDELSRPPTRVAVLSDLNKLRKSLGIAPLEDGRPSRSPESKISAEKTAKSEPKPKTKRRRKGSAMN